MSLGCYPVICVAALPASRDFYGLAAGFGPVWENEWFVLLQLPDRPDVQLGMVRAGHESVPARYRDASPSGVVITIQVDDARAAARRMADAGIDVVQELRDEPWGQRHFMVTDPDGLLVDVVQELFQADPRTV